MILRLAVRNVVRQAGRLAPLGAIVALVFTLMLAGNSVLHQSEAALRGAYVRTLTGDLSVSSVGESNFTILGSDELLIGDLEVPPTLARFDELKASVGRLDAVDQAVGVVSAAAGLSVLGVRRPATLIGTTIPDYLSQLPDVELQAGAVPRADEAAILVQVHHLPDGRSVDEAVGSRALLAATTLGSFTLREVRVAGVFRYPVDDEALESIALVDADTARAINGYVHGAIDEADLTADERDALSVDVDDLFGDSGAQPSPTTGGIDIDSLLEGFTARAQESSEDRQVLQGTWNFLLVSLSSPRHARSIARQIRALGFSRQAGYRVRPWHSTIGGNAAVVRALQLLFNAGLVFVAVGAAAVAANALALSVLQRVGEIGTLRALGSSRARVSLLIAVESIIVVSSSALVGVLLGVAAAHAINAVGYLPTNRYLAILVGGETLSARLSARLIGWHVLAALALGPASLLYPMRKALGVSPREAMAR